MERPIEEKRAIAGFVVSLIAGVLILVNSLVFFFAKAFVEVMIDMMNTIHGSGMWGRDISTVLTTLGIVGLIFAALVILGSFLIYIPGREMIGGVMVLLFSILSIFIGGGFFVGFILGIIGGALGIAKK